MRKKIDISVVLISIVIFISGCAIITNTEKSNISHGGEQEPMRTEEINLESFDPKTHKSGIDIIFNDIKVYRNNVESFSFKETYSDFALVSNGVDAAGNYAYYVIEDKVEEGLFSVEVRLTINSSASDAVECLRNFISSATSMTIYPSTAIGIYVGDLSVQGEQNG